MPLSIRKKNLSSFEVAGYLLIAFGAAILIWGVNQFNLFGRTEGLTEEDLGVRYGQYGEFIGGIVGSLWALAGVLLFFATLLYQKREFELQRTELHKTQRIYQQQSFSTLFISFLVQHNDIVSNISAYDINKAEWRGTNFFTFFKEKVYSSFIGKLRSLPLEQRQPDRIFALFKDYFTYHFRFYESNLNPYLRNLTVMLNMVDRYVQDSGEETDYYTLIIKSNLSASELFMVYHICHFNLKSEFRNLQIPFDLFENLPEEDRIAYHVKSEVRLAD